MEQGENRAISIMAHAQKTTSGKIKKRTVQEILNSRRQETYFRAYPK